jgi:hypothetical protein
VSNHNLTVALKWAGAGAHVLITAPDKKARIKWRDQSTTDAATIKSWFAQWPDSLPGIDLAKSGIVVIDGDRHDGADGVAAVEELFAEHKLNRSAIPTVLTPSDGTHSWFRQPDSGEPIGNSDKAVRDKGINVRGCGGYVIAPGTVLPDGRRYKRDQATPSTIDALIHGTIPTLPPAIVAALRKPERESPQQPKSNGHAPGTREEAYALATLNNLCAELASMAPNTGRNNNLNDCALLMGHMVAAGWISRSVVEERLARAAEAQGRSKHNVRATIKSGLDAGEKEPAAPLQERDEQKPQSRNVTSVGNNVGAKAKIHSENGTNNSVNTPKLNGDDAGAKILSSAEFIKNFVPPDYLIDGLLQRQFFYSLTGKTGAGKTALALLFAAFIAEGRTIDDREFSKGRVLYLAGENPVDVQMRWIAMSQQLDFDHDTIDVHFSPGVFQISEMEQHIAQEVQKLGGVSLVVIDTSAAYFEGDDENNNTQAGNYARMQRKLVNLPGGPTILALCHPVKNAADDNLLPRGGGAYLNEVDGNLTAQGNGTVVHLHWQGKFRGPDFAPISFQLKSVTHERLKNNKGRQLSTVLAMPLSDTGEKAIEDAGARHENEVMAILNEKQGQGATIEELAIRLGWFDSKGKPYKTLVYRTVQALKREGLVKKARRGLRLTKAGEAELEPGNDEKDTQKKRQKT